MKSADVEDGTDAHRDDPELGYRVFGRPVHDDLGAVTGEHGVIRHELNAEAPNELWLTDITEHRTGEGKLHLCAIKDVYSNRIVGYSIDSRMKSRLAVAVLNNAVAKSAADGGEVAGCVIHRDRDLNFEVGSSSYAINRHATVGSMGRVGAAGDNVAMESVFALLRKNVLDRHSWTTREELRVAIVRWISHSGCVTRPVTWSCSSPDRVVSLVRVD